MHHCTSALRNVLKASLYQTQPKTQTKKNNVQSGNSSNLGKNQPAHVANFRAKQMFLHLQGTHPPRTPDIGHPSVIHLSDELQQPALGQD